MTQTWTDDCFAGGHVGQTDLQNMENNFACLKNMFSGASAPADPVAGMPWFDTTKKVQKQRNAGNSAWIGLMHGDGSQKIWVYRNSAMDGWAIDSSVSDVVLAAKGGATYTTGGATAGSWTISGFATHGHEVTKVQDDSHTDHFYDSGGNEQVLALGSKTAGVYGVRIGDTAPQQYDMFTSKVSLAHDASWRPAAAVNTLQYLDL
jgi:hypothetical protein